jgi:hypothetical protein
MVNLAGIESILIIQDGYYFWRYPNAKQSSDRNYYKGWVDKQKISLHRYLWQKYNGDIPSGFVIHHMDGNFDNNELSNYELISRSEHQSLHYKGYTKEYKDEKTRILIDLALPKAAEWHGSPEGKEWHKSVAHYAIYGDERVFVCRECEKEFITKLRRIPLYCSRKCQCRFNARKFRNKQDNG